MSPTCSAIATLRSAALKNRRLRSLARIQRSAIRTDCSTLALSRFVRPRRQDRHAVVVGELQIAAVQARLVAVRVGDRGLEIVADHELRRAAQESEQVHVRADPVGDLLARPRRREDVARRAHGGDEQLHRPHLAGRRVDDVDRVAGEVDEHLLAGGMALPHRRAQPALEGAVLLAEPTVAEPVRMSGAILLPQERQGDALAPHLLVERRPFRSRTSARRIRGRSRREQKALQRRVVEPVRQGPAQARHAGALEIRVHRPVAERHGAPDHALAQPALELQTQDIADLPHRQSLGWHGPLAVGRGPIGRWDCRRTRPPGSSTGCSRSRGMTAHDRVELVLMIAWTERSRSSGIGAHDAVEYASSSPRRGFSTSRTRSNGRRPTGNEPRSTARPSRRSSGPKARTTS